MKVPHFPQFVANVTLLYALLKFAERFAGGIARFQSFENCFGGQHAAFHGQMNSFQALRIKEAAGITDDQHAVHGVARYRVPTAVGQRLRAVADKFAAIRQKLFGAKR